MHTKQLGNIGEMRVAANLLEKGYAVFTELGDLSRVDLIALKDNKVTRIQVKAYNEKDGVVPVRCGKRGPLGYHYVYQKEDFDVFAVYVPNRDVICYVNWKHIGDTGGITLRFDPPKGRTNKSSRMFEDYLEIE